MIPNFDPSKMNPETLAELTQLVRRLPPEQITRMQQIMQKMMIGIDVRFELEQFERDLPPGFRDQLMGLAGNLGSASSPAAYETTAAEIPPERSDEAPLSAEPQSTMSLRSARLTLLQAVAEGRLTPEEAERLLWPDS